jgi:hypothetical protein
MQYLALRRRERRGREPGSGIPGSYCKYSLSLETGRGRRYFLKYGMRSGQGLKVPALIPNDSYSGRMGGGGRGGYFNNKAQFSSTVKVLEINTVITVLVLE